MNADLRERVAMALFDGWAAAMPFGEIADKLLATIIAEVEAAAVERCAKVAESYAGKPLTANLVPFIVAAIRAQKEPSA